GFGMSAILFSFATLAAALYLKVFHGTSLILTPLPTLAVMMFSIGVLSTLMGLLAEMLNRTYHESQAKPVYRIARDVQARAPEDTCRCAGSPDSSALATKPSSGGWQTASPTAGRMLTVAWLIRPGACTWATGACRSSTTPAAPSRCRPRTAPCPSYSPARSTTSGTSGVNWKPAASASA